MKKLIHQTQKDDYQDLQVYKPNCLNIPVDNILFHN